jgi:hypothetical protein
MVWQEAVLPMSFYIVSEATTRGMPNVRPATTCYAVILGFRGLRCSVSWITDLRLGMLHFGATYVQHLNQCDCSFKL